MAVRVDHDVYIMIDAKWTCFGHDRSVLGSWGAFDALGTRDLPFVARRLASPEPARERSVFAVAIMRGPRSLAAPNTDLVFADETKPALIRVIMTKLALNRVDHDVYIMIGA